MSDLIDLPTAEEPGRDAAYWAKPTGALKVGDVSSDALNLNVEGRQTVGPLMGFGQLWQKTYRITLGPALAPEPTCR